MHMKYMHAFLHDNVKIKIYNTRALENPFYIPRNSSFWLLPLSRFMLSELLSFRVNLTYDIIWYYMISPF